MYLRKSMEFQEKDPLTVIDTILCRIPHTFVNFLRKPKNGFTQNARVHRFRRDLTNNLH